MRELTRNDELDLLDIGVHKTVLFCITSDTDTTFNFIVAILYTQLFNLLCDDAYKNHGGKLPVHVRFLLDEFANLGKIPNWEHLISVIRSRNISACMILQAKSQLVDIYDKKAGTIEGNCDAALFLGGKETETLKDLSESLGKETIDMYNTSDTRGSQQSYGMNYQKTGRDLMSRDELVVLDGSECILQVRGVRPFKSKKFNIEGHRNYKYLADYDKKNVFDVEKYISEYRRQKGTAIPETVAKNAVTEMHDIGDLGVLAAEIGNAI